MRVCGDPFWFASTHMGCDVTMYEQSASVPKLVEFVESLGKSTVVIGGDFNSYAVQWPARTLVSTNGWKDLWYDWGIRNGMGYLDGCTMPAWRAWQRIDFLFLTGDALEARDSAVVQLDAPYASDHNPVVATCVVQRRTSFHHV